MLACTAVCLLLGLGYFLYLNNMVSSAYDRESSERALGVVLKYGFQFWLIGCIAMNLVVCLLTFILTKK